MKKIISILLATIMLVSSFAVVSFAATSYEQPFNPGTENSKTFRIPSILTLNDGSVLAAADARYDHGADSPQNLDTVVSKSKNGYTGWTSTVVNYFDDYPDGVSNKNSASFIDPVMVQTSTGRVILIVDAFPSGGGAWTKNNKGTGYITLNNECYLALTNTDNNQKSIDEFEFYIGKFNGSMATVYDRDTKEATAYSVDKEYRLYKDGQPLYMTQNGTDKKVRQNVFYIESDLTVYSTMYQWLRYSEDNGETWSEPTIITSQIKTAAESFLGIAPGRGITVKVGDKERIIFSLYENSETNMIGVEKASIIFSDDNGETWHRNLNKPPFTDNLGIGKTSESQLVTLPDGTIRMYSRSNSNWIAYTDSKDNGITWSQYKTDLNLEGTANCMVSFINYNSKKINGKHIILASYASNLNERADGVVRVGLVNSDNSIDWVSSYRLNDGFFAYSCLTELSDGNIGILCEEQQSGIISYKVLSMDDEGKLSDVTGSDPEQEIEETFWEKIQNWFKRVWNHILRTLGLI